MHESNFRKLDLNLLVVFAVIFRERSVTRAADRLGLSQSAVSHALRRLRTALDDALFVKSAHGLTPTPHAQAISVEINRILDASEHVLLRGKSFDAATSDRTFVIGVPGAVDVCVTGVLLRELAQSAPHINIVVRPSDLHVGAAQLDDNVIDLAISVFPAIESWHRRLSLGWRNYACLFDPRQLPIRSPVRLKDYVSVNHVLTSFNGERYGVVDEALAKIGQKRRIVAATMDFSSVPFYLASTASIATLPAYAAAAYGKRLRLTTSPPPISLPDFELSMIWHARDDQDAGHIWFRSLLADVTTRTTTGN